MNWIELKQWRQSLEQLETSARIYCIICDQYKTTLDFQFNKTHFNNKENCCKECKSNIKYIESNIKN